MSRQDIADELLTLLGGGPRDHRVDAGLGVRAVTPSPRHPRRARRGGRRRTATSSGRPRFSSCSARAPSSTSPVVTSRRRHSTSVSGESRTATRSWSASPTCTRTRSSSRTRSGSIRTASSATEPPTFAWIPFGGGTRRCVGAAFANTEMDVVLRTVLRHFRIDTDDAPDEKVHPRGVAYTPKDGGRVVVHRRK